MKPSRDTVHATAAELHTIARKLDVRAGLTSAPLLRERAAEWAASIRRAEQQLLDFSVDLSFPQADPAIGMEPVV